MTFLFLTKVLHVIVNMKIFLLNMFTSVLNFITNTQEDFYDLASSRDPSW